MKTLSNHARVIFTSDDGDSGTGFKLKWKAVSASLSEFLAVWHAVKVDSYVASDRIPVRVVYVEPPLVIDDYFYDCLHQRSTGEG